MLGLISIVLEVSVIPLSKSITYTVGPGYRDILPYCMEVCHAGIMSLVALIMIAKY